MGFRKAHEQSFDAGGFRNALNGVGLGQLFLLDRGIDANVGRVAWLAAFERDGRLCKHRVFDK